MSERPPQHKNYGLVNQNQALFESPLVDQHQLKNLSTIGPELEFWVTVELFQKNLSKKLHSMNKQP